MKPRPPLNALSQSLPYVRRSCLRRRLIGTAGQRRSISANYLKKGKEAEEQWAAQARDIRQGRQDSMLTVLEKRGYVNSIAGDRDALDKLMTEKRIGAYVGVDPTAPSMHVGHLVPFMALFWLHVNGFRTVSLLGGATAKIGDPTGRTVSREDQPSSVRKVNMVAMHFQLKRLWANVEVHVRKYGYKWEWAWRRELANNNAWFNKLPMLELLKVLGPGVRIGTMLGRDTVRNKMEKGDGLSFAEFTYPIMQAWDWWYMYQTKGVQLQLGGSDQFGNIIAGIDAINHVRKTHYDPDVRQEKENPLMKPVGFTVPLLTAASGEKLGKSAGNAIWLSKDLTSAFELHQYFFRTPDADVGRYLRLFTFIPLSEIDKIMAEQAAAPPKRPAQRRLAREVIELIHGLEEANAVEIQAEMLFRPTTASLSKPTDPSSPPDPTEQSPDNPNINPSLNRYAPQTNSINGPQAHITLPESLVHNRPIARILYSAGLVSSRSEGHRLAVNQGAYIGSRPGGGGGMRDQVDFVSIKHWFPEETQKYIIEGDLLILRVGKWKVKIVKIVSDEEFEKMGGTAPGWEERHEEKRLEALSTDKRDLNVKKNAGTKELTGKKKKEEDNLPNWKKKVSNKYKKKAMRRELMELADLNKMKKENDAEWKEAGFGIGKRFKVPKLKFRKYFDGREPEERPLKIRYHMSDEGI